MKKSLYFIGAILLQLLAIFVIILLLLAIMAYNLPIALALSAHPIIGTIIFTLLGLIAIFLIPALLIVSAILVYKDVARLKKRNIDAWFPVGWALTILIFWFPGLAIYLTLKKFAYKK